MNLVGKIFVVLIFVMSLVFMSFAVAVYATHKNWMMAVDNPTPTAEHPLGYKQQLENARNELAAKEEERRLIEQDLSNLRDRKDQDVAKLEHQAETLRQERDALKAEQDDLREDLRKSVAALEIAQNNLAAAEQERSTLRAQNKELTESRDTHFREMVKLTDELHDARFLYERLKKTNAELAEQVTQMELVFDDRSINWQAIAQGQDPPNVSGVVLASRDSELLEMSIGSDDGLAKGHELDVHRGGKYLGRVVVERTTADRSVGRVVRNTLQDPIQEGDRVRTTIRK